MDASAVSGGMGGSRGLLGWEGGRSMGGGFGGVVERGGAREGQWRSGSAGGQGDSWPTNLITAAEMETLIPGEGN